ncbi:hypothetical protein EBU99_07425 [bacterium]|nr:hypothetical protein [bacterium]
MLKSLFSKPNSESGSTITTSLVLISGVALASTAMVVMNKNLRSARIANDQSAMDRRANESAIQAVSQLVSTGQLQFNKACGRLEPNEKDSLRYEFKAGCGDIVTKVGAINCASAGANSLWVFNLATVDKCAAADKKCAAVSVCVPVSVKKDGKTVTENKEIAVSFMSYQAQTDSRNYAHVRAQRKTEDGKKFAQLDAQLSMGLASGNEGLLGKNGAADVCFYMRPKTFVARGGTNLGFAARALDATGKQNAGKYSLLELEPRPDGPNEDEFGQNIPLPPPQEIAGNYAVVSEYRNKIISENIVGKNQRARPPQGAFFDSEGMRSSYPYPRSTILGEVNYAQHLGNAFVGVTPGFNKDGTPKDSSYVGPRFEYFLSDTNGHDFGRTPYSQKFDGSKMANYKAGCGSSAGTPGADFCARVAIPVASYTASLRTKCALETRKVPSAAPASDGGKKTILFSDIAVQVACNPAWAKVVQDQLDKESALLMDMPATDQLENETSASMAMSAIEVSDDFIAGAGKWSSHPLRAAFNSFKAGITTRFEGDQDSYVDDPCTDDKGKPSTCRRLVKGEERSFTAYSVQSLDRPEQLSGYQASSCAYFKYYRPDDPSTCQIAYTTSVEAGYVCRNHDGCFDITTSVKMADGSLRRVDALKLGELVHNPITKTPARIAKLTIGPENKPLIHVTIGNAKVKVTDSHPFMSKRGWVVAKDLKLNDQVLSADGSYKRVGLIEIGESGRMVANLALEGPADQSDLHYVLADGVVTGDLVIQNMLMKSAKNAAQPAK